MFGDFGNASHRRRFPREHSPFDSFRGSHAPMFPRSSWEEESGFAPPPPPHSSENNSHVERIIPIQIVNSTPSSTTQSGPKNNSSEGEEAKFENLVNNSNQASSGASENKEKKRAHSEPPLQFSTKEAQSPQLNKGMEKEPIPLHNFGKSSSKGPSAPPSQTSSNSSQNSQNSSQNQSNNFRQIPIVVEGKSARSPPPPPKNNFEKSAERETSKSPPPPPTKKQSKCPLDVIAEIVAEVQELEKEVHSLGLTSKSCKNYIYLDEMLTRNLIKLDVIETEGKEDVRVSRKNCIKLIQNVINVLEGNLRDENGQVLTKTTEDLGLGAEDMKNECETEAKNDEIQQNSENLAKNEEKVEITAAVPVFVTETKMEVSPPPPPAAEPPLVIDEKGKIEESASATTANATA